MKVAVIDKSVYADGHSSYITISVEILPVKEVGDDTD